MTADHFEATFRVRVDRAAAWQRLTENRTDDDHLWLPGFDSQVTVADEDPLTSLHVTKDNEPCAGTDIVISLEDADTGTHVRVVQSRFGDWLPARYEMMSVGWRSIVADLHTYLATGVHARRHLRAWPDFGAEANAADGGIMITRVRPGGTADQLGLIDGDLLVSVAGAPVSSLDDLTTVLRVITPTYYRAEWVRSGMLSASAQT